MATAASPCAYHDVTSFERAIATKCVEAPADQLAARPRSDGHRSARRTTSCRPAADANHPAARDASKARAC